jgi:hypothetical protein
MLLLLLAGGAIVNIAVAWGVWLVPQVAGNPSLVPGLGTAELQWWQAHAPDGFATEPTTGLHYNYHVGLRMTDMAFEERGGPRVGGLKRQSASRVRSGWPMSAVEGATWLDTQQPQPRVTLQTLFIPPHGWPGPKGAIPYAPMPLGFTINTLFYAFILWLLFVAPFALRRWRRIKRGLCVKCGYDLRGGRASDSSVCPECGAAVPLLNAA